MLKPLRKRWLVAVLAILAAGTFFATSIEAQIVHQHRSAASEATCPICHLLHRVAVQGISGPPMARPHPLSRKAVPRGTLVHVTPFFSPHSPRAPPAA